MTSWPAPEPHLATKLRTAPDPPPSSPTSISTTTLAAGPMPRPTSRRVTAPPPRRTIQGPFWVRYDANDHLPGFSVLEAILSGRLDELVNTTPYAPLIPFLFFDIARDSVTTLHLFRLDHIFLYGLVFRTGYLAPYAVHALVVHTNKCYMERRNDVITVYVSISSSLCSSMYCVFFSQKFCN